MRAPERERELSGLALACLGALAFGTTAVIGKFGYRAGAEPVSLLAVRFTVASALLLPFFRRPVPVGPRTACRLLALGAVGYAVESFLFFAALEHAPAGVVTLVFYSYPLWTNLLGVAVGLETFRAASAVALALGSAGVLLIFSLPQGGTAGPLLAWPRP